MKQTQISNIRIDSTAIIAMITAMLIGVVIIIYKFINYVPCPNFHIDSFSQNYSTGESIKFSSDIKSYKELEWSFGDGVITKTNLKTAYHIFKSAGDYTIILTADNSCKEAVNINISDAPIILDSTKVPWFKFPNSAVVGVPVKFENHSKDAIQWAWRFGETGSIDATSPNPSYVFRSPGLKTIALMINNDIKRVHIEKIYVNPATPHSSGGSDNPAQIIVVNSKPRSNPIDTVLNKRLIAKTDSSLVPPISNPFKKTEPHMPNVTSVNKAPAISKEQLEAMLKQVPGNGLPESYLAKYMKDIKNTEVNLNNHPTSFDDFYNQLKELKKSSKIKTLNVQMVKDPNGYIERLNVEFEKRSLLDL